MIDPHPHATCPLPCAILIYNLLLPSVARSLFPGSLMPSAFAAPLLLLSSAGKD